MSVIKCKMCGGDLELIEGSSVAVCEYCGTQQTVPAADNEKKLTLFARANRLRLACEFDKAAGVYESIVADFPEEAEAYWGLVLCRYGIEYVDDPATGKKIPTCHRSSFDSVMEDSDFEQALENADAVARRVYRDEAKAIEELRRGIVEVSGKEPPYDIFICYKETAEDGQRTVDSVIAQDVYDALTEKGYRVFFSRISLEDKLGTEYEPYIFAALHSAKIMLAFGTDYEYYNAVWVKNEWSRYLQLMTKDKSKHLIPCYKGIDAYDMPKEFAKLQAQDMGKVGAMQDLLRGVDKIMGKGAGAAPANNETTAVEEDKVTPLLRRIDMFLADAEWENAVEYCNRILDIAPECATAYIDLLLSQHHARTISSLSISNSALQADKNFIRAKTFAKGAEEGLIRSIEENAQKQDTVGKKLRTFLNPHMDPSSIKCQRKPLDIVAYDEKAYALTADGRVLLAGTTEKWEKSIVNWSDIIEIACGKDYVAGLNADGTVKVVAKHEGLFPNVASWYGIKSLHGGETSMGREYLVGLHRDGTVISDTSYAEAKQAVDRWSQVASLWCKRGRTVGLCTDGRVLSTQAKAVSTYDKYLGESETTNWQHIHLVSCGLRHTVGVRSDGTVVAVGVTGDGRCDVMNWSNIVDVCCGDTYTLGLKSDGTVVFAGKSDNLKDMVRDWNNVVSVCCSEHHVACLHSDGTVTATGSNIQGQCDVETWENVVGIFCGNNVTFGVKADGSIYSTKTIFDAEWNLFKDDEEVQKRSAYLDSLDILTERQAAEEHLIVVRIQKEKLVSERESLLAAIPQLTGLFSEKKRKKAESRLAEIERELASLMEGKQ